MNGFVVRLKDTHEVVGVFCCKRSMLPYLVDEVCECILCEFAMLGAGGVVWRGHTDISIPCVDDNIFGSAGLSETWLQKMFNEGRDLRWSPV